MVEDGDMPRAGVADGLKQQLRRPYMDMKTLRRQARERMNGACRVCAQCDGKACAGELPGMGGIRTGASFRANVLALEKTRLKMRLIHEVRQPETACEILGLSLKMPVLAAPMAGTAFNMGKGLSEERFAQIITEGARQAGIVACTGDGPAESFESGLNAVQAAQGWGIPVIKPWAQQAFFERLELAAQAGCQVVGMDIDTAALTALAKSGRPVSPKSRKELTEIVQRTHDLGLKFMLKGVLCVEDALAAEDCGCDAVVVSNHGGRAFEAVPGTAEVLPDIAENVHHMTVLADGGVRSGADVLKMLALGAEAVLVGRPLIMAAMGGEEEGVRLVLSRMRRQLEESMLLTGCATVREAGPHLLA